MEGQMTFEFAKRPTIKGYPELRWTGKRPYESTQYYPAQLRERYGEETNGWINKIFWGDNLQVMSHLLKEYRGKVQLIYIDPPFDSRVDYKMKVELKGKKATNDISTFEEKQYGDIVFDCFMGSGTTQAVAMKLGRKFIGADINLGAVQVTTKRLLQLQDKLAEPMQEIIKPDVIDLESGKEEQQIMNAEKYTGFEVYNVNNYDFFRNPIEARDLIIQALEIQPFPQSDVWDGELDGRMVKIMPVNRIATKADLEELKANLPYKTYEKRKAENPMQPVEKITIVCMGHEPDLKASLEQELSEYKLNIEIVDILRDKKDLQLKREAEAEIVKEGNKLVIRSFYPMNLMQKLSLQKEYVEDWRQLVESIMIDWNYDGVVMQPAVTDVPDKKKIVRGIYDIPEDAGTIRVKITDLLAESLEMEVE